MNTTLITTATQKRSSLQKKAVQIQHTQAVTALAWSPLNEWPFGRRYIASADAGGMVKVSDSEQGATHAQLIHHDEVAALAWSPDTTTLAAACHDGGVQVWGTQSWSRGVTYRKHTYRGMPSAVRGVSYTRDGRYIASCGDDQTVRIWDAFTGETLLRYYRGHSCAITCVAWSPDGRAIASGDNDGVVRIWDAATGQTLQTYQGHGARVAALAWSTSGYSIVTASWDGTVQVWNAHTGETLLTYRGLPQAEEPASRKWLGIAFAPGVARIASVGEKQPAQIWDERTGQLLTTFGDRSASVRAVAWSPDGRFIATSDGGKAVRIW